MTTLDDAILLQRFRACEIPSAEWTHEAHLRIALLHVRAMPLPQAIDALRAGILALNEVHGVPTTPERGYHETITVAWAHVLADALRAGPSGEPTASTLARRPDLLDKRHLGRFYSTERLMSREARAAFLPPDLEPLPGS